MIICIAMVVVAFAHVIWRYVFNSALTWSKNFAFTLVWFALLSASIIQSAGHIGIVIFRDRMPKNVQRIIIRLLTYVEMVATIAGTVVG